MSADKLKRKFRWSKTVPEGVERTEYETTFGEFTDPKDSVPICVISIDKDLSVIFSWIDEALNALGESGRLKALEAVLKAEAGNIREARRRYEEN